MEEENKKAKIRIVTLVIILLLLINVVLFMYFYRTRVRREIAEQEFSSTISMSDVVEIKGKKISNEEKFDRFLESVGLRAKDVVYVKYNDDYYILEYFPGKNLTTNLDFNSVDIKELNLTDDQINNGFIKVTENSVVKYVFDITTHSIKRRIDGNKVIVYVADYVNNKDNFNLFEYSAESSEYQNSTFQIVYERDSEESTKSEILYDYVESEEIKYKVNSIGGTVKIIIDGKEYLLKDALENGLITPKDILTQAELDYKYGICSGTSYWDDSIEYYYQEYTILKMNDYLHNSNFYIGYPSVLRGIII